LAEPELVRLVGEALDEFESVPLAATIRRAIRIARLRGDLVPLLWLSLEHGTFEHRREIRDEIAAHFTADDFKRIHEFTRERWIRERSVELVDVGLNPTGEEMVDATSVANLEDKVEYFWQVEQSERALGNLDLAAWVRNQRWESIRVLDEVRARTHTFLSRTEVQLLAGQRPDVLVRARQYVLDRVGEIAPEAVGQIEEAEAALAAGASERWSHAVLTCRRLLKTLADALYPAQGEPVVGKDGVERNLTENRYIARLWQFAYERAGGHAAGEVTLTAIDDLGRRIDALYDATNKGVHDVVSEAEAAQLVTQTIMLCGDLLRLRDNVSAIKVEVEDDLPDTEPPVLPPS
jgi:hypothetical protein